MRERINPRSGVWIEKFDLPSIEGGAGETSERPLPPGRSIVVPASRDRKGLFARGRIVR